MRLKKKRSKKKKNLDNRMNLKRSRNINIIGCLNVLKKMSLNVYNVP